LAAIFQFETRYCEQIVDRHGRITPPNFDDARKLPIDSIFVPPNFRTRQFSLRDFTKLSAKAIRERFLLRTAEISKDRIEFAAVPHFLSQKILVENLQLVHDKVDFGIQHISQTMDQVLSGIYRTVILGNPGGGKSTFTNKVCYDLASNTRQRELGTKRFTPMPVVLREFGSEKKANKISILRFLELTCSSKYQLDPPPGAFEYLLLNGHAVVIFDGLDELLDTGYRQEIRDDIESFCSLYPSVPVIVTSREVGYEQAPLDKNQFQTFYLAPFNEEQVGHYVKNWFHAGTELPPLQKQSKARDFLEESEIVSDLRSNPLMLGLMCNIYRGENYIPRNRPDVYRKCAEMLFERWDRSRDIPVRFHFEDDIRPAMAYLAHWIYSDAKLQEGVTEEDLVSTASAYLLSHKYEDRDLAERAAREFIEFCRGRAWVFTETGTDKNGNGIYQFTHRTFLEYFTAVYIVRTHETTQALVKKLLPRIAKQEWDIVAQLAFQIKNRSAEGATDKLLNLVLDHMQKTSNIRALNLLFFASRCLEFMEPSPKLIRALMTNFFKNCVINVPSQNKASEIEYTKLSEAVLRALISAEKQNRATIAESIKDFMADRSTSRITVESKRALEISLHLDRALISSETNREVPTELRDYWIRVSNEIGEGCESLIRSAALTDRDIAVDAFARNIISATNVLEHHGPDALFRATQFKFFNGLRQRSVAVQLLSAGLLALVQGDSDQRSLSELANVGRTLGSTSTPFIKEKLPTIDLPSSQMLKEIEETSERDIGQMELVEEALFGAFVLLATLSEARKEVRRQWEALAQGNEVLDPRKLSSQVVVYFENASLIEFQAANLLQSDIEESLKKSRSHLLRLLHSLLVSRLDNMNESLIQSIIDKLSFKPTEQDFVWRWVRGKSHLVKSEQNGKKDTKAGRSTEPTKRVGA
jgi:hypothetical protein